MASTASVLSDVEPVAHVTTRPSVDRTSGRGTAPRLPGSSSLKQKLSAPSSAPLQHCACRDAGHVLSLGVMGNDSGVVLRMSR